MALDITVVIPNYNMERYVGLAIRSALDQTVDDFEVLVIDDGSTDDSLGVVERIGGEDSRLRVVVHKKNRGLSATRNSGIRNSRTKYVTFLDSDDLFARERVETLHSRLDSGGTSSVVYTDYVGVNATDENCRAATSRARFRPEGLIFTHLLAGRFRFTGGLIALPKACFDEVGYFDESLRWAEDTDMVLRLSAKFPFLFEHLCTYGWRNHPGSSSVTMSKRLRFEAESRVLERHLIPRTRELDSVTKRQAFDRLFGCYIGASRWGRLARTSLIDSQAFISMLTIPVRALRPRRLLGR